MFLLHWDTEAHTINDITNMRFLSKFVNVKKKATQIVKRAVSFVQVKLVVFLTFENLTQTLCLKFNKALLLKCGNTFFVE